MTQTSNPKFEIEEISIIANVGALVMARKLNELDFELGSNSLLGGVPISGGDIPRKLSETGAPSLSSWGFFLKNQNDKDKFQKGQVVELTQSNE